jgi:membrane associated rhomboid family serine protease
MPDLRSVSAKLAVGLVVGSVANSLAGHPLDLVPGLVIDLPVPQVWRLLTYAFVANDPFSVIFGAMLMVSVGSVLEAAWGPRRLLTFSLGVTVLAGAITTGVFRALLPDYRFATFEGAWVMGSAMWVAYGLYVGRGQTNFWGIPVTGNMLAMIGAGFVILSALMGSMLGVLPQLLALMMTWAYMRGANPRLLWLRWQNKRLQQRQRRRSSHLKVLTPDRNTPRDSDHFLH